MSQSAPAKKSPRLKESRREAGAHHESKPRMSKALNWCPFKFILANYRVRKPGCIPFETSDSFKHAQDIGQSILKMRRTVKGIAENRCAPNQVEILNRAGGVVHAAGCLSMFLNAIGLR